MTAPSAPTPPDGGRALRCPYCSATLSIEMQTVGPAYLSYETPESIACDNLQCEAAWEPNGAPRDEPRWIRYPDAYSPPTQEPSR